jgi:hypothetical protein
MTGLSVTDQSEIRTGTGQDWTELAGNRYQFHLWPVLHLVEMLIYHPSIFEHLLMLLAIFHGYIVDDLSYTDEIHSLGGNSVVLYLRLI